MRWLPLRGADATRRAGQAGCALDCVPAPAPPGWARRATRQPTGPPHQPSKGDAMSSSSATPVVVQDGGGIDTAVNREFLRHMVGRQITCAETGCVLDVRDAVAVEITHTATDRCAALQVTTAEAYDRVVAARAASCAELEDYTVTVYDGRILFGGRS